ncbi:hypothetical protein WCX72_09980 [Sulfurimonas sp. HSL1-6]|uniref:phage tail assembly protein T n=1 Tax=Thiomicrolovo immobilis TaxID=3131935 RepID=UPI0031F9D4F0
MDATLSYEEFREWEEYFSIEPPASERMEIQIAMLIQMISGFMWKKPGEMQDFMVCATKRKKQKSKASALLTKVKALFKEEA